jgi:hypothetical protein
MSHDIQDQAVEALLGQGWARADDILRVAFGAWPLQGLDIVASPIKLIQISDYQHYINDLVRRRLRDETKLVRREHKGLDFKRAQLWATKRLLLDLRRENPYAGMATKGGTRMWLRRYIPSKRRHMSKASVVAHEIEHNFQDDNYADDLLKRLRKFDGKRGLPADAELRKVREAEIARIEERMKKRPSVSGQPYLWYLREGSEVQARLVQVYRVPKWRLILDRRWQTDGSIKTA